MRQFKAKTYIQAYLNIFHFHTFIYTYNKWHILKAYLNCPCFYFIQKVCIFSLFLHKNICCGKVLSKTILMSTNHKCFHKELGKTYIYLNREMRTILNWNGQTLMLAQQLTLVLLNKLIPLPLLIFSQSNYLIQIIDINSHTEWQTVQIPIYTVCKGRVYPGSAGLGLKLHLKYNGIFTNDYLSRTVAFLNSWSFVLLDN